MSQPIAATPNDKFELADIDPKLVKKIQKHTKGRPALLIYFEARGDTDGIGIDGFNGLESGDLYQWHALLDEAHFGIDQGLKEYEQDTLDQVEQGMGGYL